MSRAPLRLVSTVALAVALAAGCGSSGSSAGAPTAPRCTPTAPADVSGHQPPEQVVAFPTGGGHVDVTVQVGEHMTVGWSGCGEHGSVETSPADSWGPLTSSDVSVYTSPRPTPSVRPGEPCCPRPQADGVFSVRYLAQLPGTQVLHGKGSAGSDGDIAVTVTPLTAQESRLVSGVVDSSGLHDHPGPEVVYFQPAGDNPTQTIAKPGADGHFSSRLRPGTYTLTATSPSYNDGRAQCVLKQPVVVSVADIGDVRIVCTERR